MDRVQDYCKSKVRLHHDHLVAAGWQLPLAEVLARRLTKMANPNCQRFYAAIQPLLTLGDTTIDSDSDVIQIGSDMVYPEWVEPAYKRLVPWRKGPYRVMGVDIDSEWRSNVKWDRISHLDGLFSGKRVLDVGCNSGYYLFKVAAFHPRIAVGVDPSDLFFFQYHALTQGLPNLPIAFLPLRLDELGQGSTWFDTILCMGILYHQRSPIDALRELRGHLKPSGTLILETIIIDSPGDFSLTPARTYAKMANVYYLPTLPCLLTWVRRAGFRVAEVIDVSKTGPDEQRRTDWVNTESLADFLDPIDCNRTVEGYPAPTRAILRCQITGS